MDNEIIKFYPNDDVISMYDLGLILENYLKQINIDNSQVADAFLKIINEAEEKCIEQGLIKKYNVNINEIESVKTYKHREDDSKALDITIDVKSGKNFVSYNITCLDSKITNDFYILKYPYTLKGKLNPHQEVMRDICKSGSIKKIYQEAFYEYEEEICKNFYDAFAKFFSTKFISSKIERNLKNGKKIDDHITYMLDYFTNIYPVKYKLAVFEDGYVMENGYLNEKNSIRSLVYIKKYDYEIKNMPEYLLDYIKHYFTMGYELESGQIVLDKPNDDAKLVYYLDNRTKELSIPLIDLKRSLLESFKTFLLKFKSMPKEEDIIDVDVKEVGNAKCIEDKQLHSSDTRESIKDILLNLSKNNKEINYNQKIRLSNEIFFYMEDGIKKVDTFFLNKDIIKYCDLSSIDFTNALLEGVDLSFTGAHIILKNLYNKSIKDANLRGINLLNQDLNDILATNADLRDTCVFVDIDKSAIKNAKFSDTSTFFLNKYEIDIETAELMGINIEKTKSIERIRLTY